MRSRLPWNGTRLESAPQARFSNVRSNCDFPVVSSFPFKNWRPFVVQRRTYPVGLISGEATPRETYEA